MSDVLPVTMLLLPYIQYENDLNDRGKYAKIWALFIVTGNVISSYFFEACDKKFDEKRKSELLKC